MPCLVAVELVGQTSSLTSYFDLKKVEACRPLQLCSDKGEWPQTLG